MKFFAVAAIATVAAQDEPVDYGHDCIKEQACLKKPELYCINTADGSSAFCQDCDGNPSRTWEDGVVFACPNDSPAGDEEGSSALVASAAAFLAGAALMA